MSARNSDLLLRLHRRNRIAVTCAVGASTVALLTTTMVIEPHLRAVVDTASRLPATVAKHLLAVTALATVPPASDVPQHGAPANDPLQLETAVSLATPTLPTVPSEGAAAGSHQSMHGGANRLAAAINEPTAPATSEPAAASDAGANSVAAPVPSDADLNAEAGIRALAPAASAPQAAWSERKTSEPALPVVVPSMPTTPIAASSAPPPPATTGLVARPPNAPTNNTSNAPAAIAVAPAVAAAVEKTEPRSVAMSLSPRLGALGPLPVIVAFPLGAGLTAPVGNSVQVVVRKIRSQRGSVHCTIFASPGLGFPSQTNLAQGDIDVGIADRSNGALDYQTDCSFSNVPRGMYAVVVYHDENENGRFDRNWTSTPVEGRGASNNAKGGFGPVRFSDAAFNYAGGSETVTIDMDYLSQ